jgi:hypothetical protein
VKRRDRPRLSIETARAAWELWSEDGKLFCACGCGERAISWHHVFDQSDYPELIDVLENVVPVASRCHSRHTNAVERFPRSVCRQAETLPLTPVMTAYLERFYREAA